ncbi:hypothetical protein AB0876_32330 [Mycobacterium sp. NPDC049093]
MSVRPQLTERLCALDVDDPDFQAGFTLLTMTVLEAAYRGDLDPDWRTEFIGSQCDSGGDIAAALEVPVVAVALVGMETQPWEPYAAGGDWRQALDAWEFAYAALVNHYFSYYAGSDGQCRAAGVHAIELGGAMRTQMTPVPGYWAHSREYAL